VASIADTAHVPITRELSIPGVGFVDVVLMDEHGRLVVVEHVLGSAINALKLSRPQLAEIGLDRAAIFERMAETAIPETMGCWAMPVGNFDSQLISVGMSQWNYGTGSLQPVLAAWRDGFHSRRQYRLAGLAAVFRSTNNVQRSHCPQPLTCCAERPRRRKGR